MTNQVLEWTLAEIPDEDDPPDTAPMVSKLGAPAQQRRSWAWSRLRVPGWRATRRQRVALLLGLLLAAMGVTGHAVSQAGWRRVEQQVAEAVFYEEAQARARQVNAVLAAQVHTDGGWLAERAIDVAQGRPAPSPAPQLRLLPGAPAVSGLTATYIDQVQATVVRSYADAAGRVYQFEWVQTYVSRQPGIWLRQPTETEAMRSTATWAGARLSASFPVADQAWMSATLPLIEADLETTCAGWQCPSGLVAPLVFTNSLPLAPSQAGQIVLLSPHLSGWPRDDAASQALRAAVTARALLFVADQTAGGEPGLRDHTALRDALLARAETWLGQPPGLDEALKAARL